MSMVLCALVQVCRQGLCNTSSHLAPLLNLITVGDHADALRPVVHALRPRWPALKIAVPAHVHVTDATRCRPTACQEGQSRQQRLNNVALSLTMTTTLRGLAPTQVDHLWRASAGTVLLVNLTIRPYVEGPHKSNLTIADNEQENMAPAVANTNALIVPHSQPLGYRRFEARGAPHASLPYRTLPTY